MAVAIGAAEKAREQVYERAFRPPEKRYEPWLARCRTQMHGALAAIERYCERARQPLAGRQRESQADITVSCAFTFLRDALPRLDLPMAYPRLTALSDRCEAMPAFSSTRVSFFALAGSSSDAATKRGRRAGPAQDEFSG